MSELAINPQTSRMRQLVWPREHGAWGILAVPLITGAAIALVQAERLWPLLLFTIAAGAVFCLRTPVESLLGSTPMRTQSEAERTTVARYALLFCCIALLALTALLWHGQNPALLLLGAVSGLLFGIQSVVRRLGRRARTASQLIGALGLTSTSAGAYYVVTGHLDRRALVLWLVNWLFAANQIHFVHARIRGARLSTPREKLTGAWSYLCGEVAMLIVLGAAWRMELLPLLALLAFLPVLLRGTLWFLTGSGPLQVRRLGLTELAHAIAFGVLLIVGYVV